MLYKVTSRPFPPGACDMSGLCSCVRSLCPPDSDQLLRLGTFVWNGCTFNQLSVDSAVHLPSCHQPSYGKAARGLHAPVPS